ILLLTLLISSRMLIVRSVGESVLRALGKYYMVAAFALFDAIAFAALMILATYRKLGLSDVIWIYTLSNVPGFLFLIASIIQWTRREKIRLRIARKTLGTLLRSSVPLAVGTACLTIHTQIDNLLLDKLSNATEVSNYGATMRLSAAMAPFSLVMAAVASPELTRLLRRKDDVRSRQLTSIALRMLLVAGVAIALTVTALSTRIVPIFIGIQYLSASSLLVWTAWMLTPIFIGTLLMDVSVAAGHSWLMTANAAVCMVAVIIGDVLLIPGAGARGAMTSKMIAVIGGAGTVLWLSRKKNYIDLRQFLSALWKTFAAAGVATGAFLLLRTISLSDFFIAFVMLLIFGLGIHFGKVLPLSEARALMKRIRHKEAMGGTA
ncbi:MAG TPA: oligosaccharide flippase family protein, partial [Candidatus Kapabacteria bacterium]